MIVVIVDTNIYFSAFYSPDGKEAEIVRRGNREELLLLSPDTVKEELERVLKLKLELNDAQVISIVSSLPTVWVPNVEYGRFLEEAKSVMPHEEDAPILACAMKFGAGILTGNTKHFQAAKTKKIPVWSSAELLEILRKEAAG
jgi:predicted nucleic acid-binding protein